MAVAMRLFHLVFVAAAFALPFCVGAQQESPSEVAEAVTVDDGVRAVQQQLEGGDDTINVKYLDLLLTPLTQEQLAKLAADWQKKLQTVGMDIARTQIALRQAKGDDKFVQELMAQAHKLSEQKSRLMERMKLIIREYEEKGGDAKAYDSYLTALQQTTVDLSDTGTAMAQLKLWLASPEGGIKWGFRVIQFVLALVVFWILAAIVGKLAAHAVALQQTKSEMLQHFVEGVVSKVILLIGVLFALSVLGVNVGALAAVIGGGAFIVGFAMQDILGNFASGFMLMLYRPFDVGNAVNVGGTIGTVQRVTMVNTVLLTPDNQTTLIPNKDVWGKVITNITANEQRRVDLTFGISYDDDFDKAKAILQQVVEAHPLVLKTPAPTIELHELADSSMNIICRPWAKTSDYWTLYWDLTAKAKKAFDSAGISIPYPQHDVYLHQVNPS